MEIKKELLTNPVVLSVLRKEYYNESIFEILNELKDKRVCYVTLNKTTESLKRAFKFRKIKDDKIFFIDAVSKGIGKEKKQDNVIFISSPAALTELSIGITESLMSNVFDAILFDSLSTLNIYGMGKSAERFASHTINKIKSENKKGVFTCLEEDVETSLIKNSFMYVDKVVNLNKFYEVLDKKKNNIALASLAIIATLVSVSFFSFGDNLGNRLSGFAVSEFAASNPSFLILLLVLLAIISFFGYNAIQLKPIKPKKLTKIAPSKQDTKQLKGEYKTKIYSWFKKTKSK